MSELIQADPAPLSPRQTEAMVKLLADDDSSIHQLMRDRFLQYGEHALPLLRPHLLSDDPIVRRRVSAVIQHLDRQLFDNRFLAFCLSHGEDLDLEEGVWLLSQTRYPEINVAGYRAMLDGFAADLRPRLLPGMKSFQVLETLNVYLFDEQRFAGNPAGHLDPDHSYLNRVIDRRSGNPISLCIVYLLVARRLGLPITGIGLPGHFLCRHQSSRDETYIDAFNRGRMLTKADCVKYLLQTNHGFQEAHLAPATARRALQRVCSNLHQIYSQTEQPDESARLQRYIVALAK